MGGVDKALLPFAGQPLLAHVLDRLTPQVAQVAISTQGDPGRFAGFGVTVLADSPPGGQGPLSGVLAGMLWVAAQGACHLVVVPVDGPFLPLDLVARLGMTDVPRLVLAGGRQQPTFGLWPVDLAPTLAAFLASGAAPRMRDFADISRAEWVDFAEAGAFDNLNTPQDLARATGRL